jgi:hypothetical protein
VFERLQKRLHLIELRWTGKQTLVVVVRHAVSNPPPEILGKHVRDIMSAPIVYAESETFEISFLRYVTFMVRDEACFPPGDNEVFEGTSFRHYQNSQLLDSVKKSAFSHVQPHPLLHYGIYCLNDLVDVVTLKPPEISYIGMTNK